MLKKYVIGISLLSALFMQSAVAKVTVFAAASMSNALQQIAEEYKQEKAAEEIVFSFASSSTLAKQIAQGAPADIFISADLKWMDYLAEKKVIDEKSRSLLAGNRLVMIAAKDSKIDHVDLFHSQWHKLLDNNYLAMGDPNHVPAGIYGKQALTYLGQWEALQQKIAGTNNVRAALSLVEMGEAPLGVVYATDAKASQKVKVVAIFPEQSHPAVEYPMAIINDRGNAETQTFFQYLVSEKAKNILVSHGFLVK